MTIEIAAGWWLLPLAITVAAFIWAMLAGREQPGLYGGGLIFNLLVWFAATIPALVAWLIWAVLT
jgi:hypothetical protein